MSTTTAQKKARRAGKARPGNDSCSIVDCPSDSNFALGEPLIVVDVDARHGGKKTLKALAKQFGWPGGDLVSALPVDWLAHTSCGWRYYLRLPVEAAISNRMLPGLEIFTVRSVVDECWEYTDKHRLPPPIPYSWLWGLRELPADWSPPRRSRRTRRRRTPKQTPVKPLFEVCHEVGSLTESAEETGGCTLVSVSTRQRILRVCNRHLVQMVGTRHGLTMGLCRELYHLRELRTLAAEELWFSFIKLQWYEPSKRKMRANERQAFRIFCSLWDKQNRNYLDPVDIAYTVSISRPLPGTAMRYRSPLMRRLVALCAALGEKGEFYLSCRKAADVTGANYRHVATCLAKLVHDGVLWRDNNRQPNRAYRYRYLGGDLPHSAAHHAQCFLRESLAGGARLTRELIALAKNRGIPERPLRRAKSQLKVKAIRSKRTWYWELAA